MKVWFDPSRKMVSFYGDEEVCLDFFFSEGTVITELYDGENLVEGVNITNLELSMEQVAQTPRTMDL